jgi:hypothetical protein
MRVSSRRTVTSSLTARDELGGRQTTLKRRVGGFWQRTCVGSGTRPWGRGQKGAATGACVWRLPKFVIHIVHGDRAREQTISGTE